MPRENMTDWDDKLYQKVDRYNLVPNLEECLQCGKCTGNCPVAALHPSYNPRQIIHDILLGETERLLQSEEIWRCMWCANCYRVCPVDIHYPLLMMQLRYLALENGYGLKYVTPINKYAFRAMEKGLTFVPGQKGVEKIMGLREGIGVEPWPAVSEKAISEYSEIFKQTGAFDWMKALDEVQAKKEEKPVVLSFLGGRLIDEQYDTEEGN
ncbi:cob--com heterodisulfide reductase subunit c [hydrocarbon metagenome]|uniref:Cob--com heterodisulfide reductase subunit c n=1 Tax=hydrocarbon metagenome TaxID=938273 RepID=A0A0W8E6N9_9ZZZZ